jgi:hypothetical protein
LVACNAKQGTWKAKSTPIQSHQASCHVLVTKAHVSAEARQRTTMTWTTSDFPCAHCNLLSGDLQTAAARGEVVGFRLQQAQAAHGHLV